MDGPVVSRRIIAEIWVAFSQNLSDNLGDRKEVEYGQLRLQLEKALMEQTQVAKGQASEAETTVTALQVRRNL